MTVGGLILLTLALVSADRFLRRWTRRMDRMLVRQGQWMQRVTHELAALRLQEMEREETEAVRLARYTINRLLPETHTPPLVSGETEPEKAFRPGETVVRDEAPLPLSWLTGNGTDGR